MKPWLTLAITALTTTPASAQESIPQDPAGYVSGFGGAAWTDGNSTGNVCATALNTNVITFGVGYRF
jgi:hypothetical protein